MSTNVQVARIILDQLGNNRFIAMTGARDFVALPSGLRFTLPARRSTSPNRVDISLTERDLYDLRFYRVKSHGPEVRELATDADVYGDKLQDVFTARTGLDTRL